MKTLLEALEGLELYVRNYKGDTKSWYLDNVTDCPINYWIKEARRDSAHELIDLLAGGKHGDYWRMIKRGRAPLLYAIHQAVLSERAKINAAEAESDSSEHN